MPTEPGSALIVSAKPGPARIMSATPESQAKMATKPADAPLRPGLIACVLDAPLVSVRAAGIPRAAALTIPESRPVRVNLLESRHVSADNPEPPHASADLPESPQASADLPESPHATAVYPVSLHVSPVSLAPHGPGPPFPPPVPPPLHRPPGLCRVWSVWKPLFGGGGGSVTNLVASHHTTAAHHPWTTTPIIHCTTTHTFPSTIAPITQLSPITHLPWLFHHTCTSFTHTHISSTLPCTHRKVLFCPSWHSERFPCILFPCLYLDCLYSDRLLPAFWPCLPFDILSVCRLPRPLHCPCCWFCLAYVIPVIASDPCLFDLALLSIKAAFGSQRHWLLSLQPVFG